MRSYIDSVFGELSHDILWEGFSTVPGLGERVAIEIDTIGSAEPSDDQRKLYLALIGAFDTGMIEDLYRMISQYFYSKGISVDEDNLRAELSDPLIYFSSGEQGMFAAIQWETLLDEEHGVQVAWREDGSMQVGIIGDDWA